MPYICLAQDLDDGTVQILDLDPDSSQRHPAMDPAGATRYVNRPGTDGSAVQLDTGVLTEDHLVGLGAYLLDLVEPGGLQATGGTLTCTGALAGDTVTIGGIIFTAVNGGAVAANQEFNMNGGDNATAASLAATVTNAASIALMEAANTNFYVNAVALLNVVTLEGYFAAAQLLGPDGSLTVVSSAAARIIPDATTLALGRVFRANEHWNSCLTATIAALMARVDAGSVMTLAGINVALLANAGAEFTVAGGSNSVGVLLDFLSILSGREYRLGRVDDDSAVQQVFDVTNPSYEWNPAQLGEFTETFDDNGPGMQNGEIGPTTIGGDATTRERGNIRHSYDSAAFALSIAGGTLHDFAAGVTLYPDSDPVGHFRWTFQRDAAPWYFEQEDNARVVTVYDDDGTVLA